MPDSRWIVYARGIIPGTGGCAELWLSGRETREPHLLYAEEKRHIYGGCPSPDGKYLLFTRSAADLGPVANSRTSMSIVRLADTPMIAGTSESFNRKYPTARHGPRLDLSWGWEPHWTYAEIRDASTPGR
jgi:Tol biopolymer transport system component